MVIGKNKLAKVNTSFLQSKTTPSYANVHTKLKISSGAYLQNIQNLLQPNEITQN